MTGTNWAGNITWSASHTAAPASLDELRTIVAASEHVHVVGAGHSFSRIADTPGTLVSLHHMPVELSIGPTVRVNAGMRLAPLASWLHAHGLALPTMPSLPHITVAGAVVTATHGSGSRSLASSVRSVELVTASGSVMTLSDMPGSVVSLGALGVMTAVELAVVPSFSVAQRVWESVPWEVLVDRLDDVFGSAYSVSAFVSWDSLTVRLWVKSTSDEPDLSWTGGVEAAEPQHPVPGQPAAHCTEQLGVPGPWHERLPHFRADFTPSVGEELQSEYFVPRSRAAAALRGLAELSSELAPLVQACEVRTVAADDLWLSPAHETDSLALHFTWVADEAAVRAVLPRIEEVLSPRPHWGKLFEVPPDVLASRYPEWDRFSTLLNDFDPEGKFRNEVIDHFFPRLMAANDSTVEPVS